MSIYLIDRFGIKCCQRLKPKGWRLPTIEELHSLLDYSQYDPAFPKDHPFTYIQSDNYWSSTAFTGATSNAWFVYLSNGNVDIDSKANLHYVWTVRDPV